MPPSAAPEWLRVGWSFEITPTFAPASYASMAARMPAQPAPTTRTSCVASTWTDATERPGPAAQVRLDTVVPFAGEQARHEIVEDAQRHAPEDAVADGDAVDEQ